MPIPDDHNWSAGMLLRWVLTRDRALVLAMADDYGASWVGVEGNSVTRVRPQGWDDVAGVIDKSLPAEERVKAAVLRANVVMIPALKEIHGFLRSGDIQCQARRNGSGDIENVGREQWGGLRIRSFGGLRIRSFEGRDIAVPVTSEADRLQPRSLADYLSGSVPANDTPTVWVDPVFSAEQATKLWPQRAGSAAKNLLPPHPNPFMATGAPGRPSGGMHVISVEFDRRRRENLCEASLREEAGTLEQWFGKGYPTAQPVKRKTIENKIRADYRQWATDRRSAEL
jgi:hypothetical protein